jgi:hypothetical protein
MSMNRMREYYMGLDGCNMGAPRHHQDLKRLADCIGEGRAVEEEGMGYFAEEEELVAGVERCWRVEVAGIDREAEVPVAREGDKALCITDALLYYEMFR